MDESIHPPSIRVKRKHLRLIQEHSQVIQDLFSVRVSDKTKKDENDSSFVYMPLETEQMGAEKLSTIAAKLQVRITI